MILSKKSRVVAMADLRMALQVNMVKYGLGLSGAFGPLLVVLLTVSTALFAPVADIPILVGYMGPYAATMLGIFSIIPATMISANALVGEKEQNTLEPLLCTPLTDKELLIGKTLSSAIPCLIILYGGTIAASTVSAIILLILGAPLILIPDLSGLFFIFTAAPIMIFAVVAIMIIISGRVSRVYEAYQTSGAVVMVFLIPMFLPLLAIQQGAPSPTMISMSYLITLLIAILLFAISWFIALRRFNRDKLISSV